MDVQVDMSVAKTLVGASLDMDVPVMIWGAPGVGKSSLMHQLAAERGGCPAYRHARQLTAMYEYGDVALVDYRLSQKDNVDLSGAPSVKDGLTYFNPPAALPFVGNPAFEKFREIILFFDEIVQAMPAVQAVAFQIALDRRVGERALMPNVRIAAGGNRASDRSYAQRMLLALANRFLHVHVKSALDAWCAWAWNAGIPPKLIAFLRLRPDLLSTFDPTKDAYAFATERTWEMVGQVLGRKLGHPTQSLMISGLVGPGVAAELDAFLQLESKQPDIDLLLSHPEKTPVPTEPAVLWATAAALAYRATDETIDNVVTYCMRMPPEFAVCTMQDCLLRKPKLRNTRAFVRFATKYADVFTE